MQPVFLLVYILQLSIISRINSSTIYLYLCYKSFFTKWTIFLGDASMFLLLYLNIVILTCHIDCNKIKCHTSLLNIGAYVSWNLDFHSKKTPKEWDLT